MLILDVNTGVRHVANRVLLQCYSTPPHIPNNVYQFEYIFLYCSLFMRCNKIERYKIERYNASRNIFSPLLMHFNEKQKHHFFFRAIHHIDPLHRKQTLILPLAILGISRTAPTETSRRARNVQDICLPTVFPAMHLVSPFTSEPRKVVRRQRAACFVLHHRRQTMLVSSCSRETENTIECKEFVL